MQPSAQDDAWLDSLFEHADPNAEPDARPKVYAHVESVIDTYTRPPEVQVRVRLHGNEAQLYGAPDTTVSEAILFALADIVRRLDVPTRLCVGMDDPTVARFLNGEVATPPWLRRAAGRLFEELALGDVDLFVEQVALGDNLAPASVGVA